MSTTGESFETMEKQLVFKENLEAPVTAGDQIGELIYILGKKEIGRIPIVASEDVARAGYMDYMKKAAAKLLKISENRGAD